MQKGGSSALVIVGRGRRASKLFSSSIVSRDRDICFNNLELCGSIFVYDLCLVRGLWRRTRTVHLGEPHNFTYLL